MVSRVDGARALRLALFTVHAWLGLMAFDLVVRLGFGRVHRWMRRCRVNTRRDGAAYTLDIVWAVEEACVWYVKRAACLQRSAVTTWLLRRHGIHAELVIGYRPVPFESHAWVEVAGSVVNDRPQYQKFFAVLERV